MFGKHETFAMEYVKYIQAIYCAQVYYQLNVICQLQTGCFQFRVHIGCPSDTLHSGIV